MRNLEGTASVLMFESRQRTADVACPYCRGKVEICELANKQLKDIPVWQGISQELCFLCHRYRCTKCGRKHTEEIPLQHPGTRITERAATWIQTLLLNQMTIRGVQQITGIHWETIRRIHVQLMTQMHQAHRKELKARKYQRALTSFCCEESGTLNGRG